MSDDKPEKQQRGVLTFAQKLKLTDWLRANVMKVLQERPQMAHLARALAELHGHKVPDDTLRHLCETIGLAWEPKVVTGKMAANRAAAGTEETLSLVATLRDEVAMLRNEVLVLRREIAEISRRT